MNSQVTVFFYGPTESDVAKELVAAERRSRRAAMSRDAMSFNGEVERCTHVVIMDGVRPADREKIERAYLGEIPLVRGSDKWDGSVVLSAGGQPDRAHSFEQELPKASPRSANDRATGKVEPPQVVQRAVEPTAPAGEPEGSSSAEVAGEAPQPDPIEQAPRRSAAKRPSRKKVGA